LQGQLRTQSDNPLAPNASNSRIDPQAWFAKGQRRFSPGTWMRRMAAFRKVLVPTAGWLGLRQSRRYCHAAQGLGSRNCAVAQGEKLEPRMAGIRLNVGLVEYRRGNYAAAIAPLASVPARPADSQQARYFWGSAGFTKKFAEAVTVLEPLCPRNPTTCCISTSTTSRSGIRQKELDEKILKRMVAVGGVRRNFTHHGKSIFEPLRSRGRQSGTGTCRGWNPDLPYLHLNLGIPICDWATTSGPKRSFAEILRWSPTSLTNYEQLGVLYSRMQRMRRGENLFARR